MEVIELSTGHVFAAESVRAISPVKNKGFYDFEIEIIGVGFRETLKLPGTYRIRAFNGRIDEGRKEFEDEANRLVAEATALHRECVDKLLRGADLAPATNQTAPTTAQTPPPVPVPPPGQANAQRPPWE